jgi:cytosine/adenosine deaminase-related metal-dependent hydrolase
MANLEVCHTCFTDKINLITTDINKFRNVKDGVEVYSLVTKKEHLVGDKICLSSLNLPDSVLDACIEYVLSKKCKFMVRACEDLYESGLIESRYKLSPIMLLHKMGLLENATVVGANHIDKDDVDLMAQEGASVVFLPTHSLGKGYGVPPINFVINKLPIAFGSGEGVYNKNGDMRREANLVRLLCNEQARKENAISEEKLLSLFGSGDINDWIKETR